MAATSTIWIPCESFDVVLTSDSDGPTEFERAVLLFLAARENHTLDEVQAFLGLSERLTMDLLIGLWRQGYVLVDTIDGGVRLDEAWRRVVQLGKWDEIRSGHQVSDTIELMRELVSGQIALDRSSPAAPPPGLAAPILVTSALADAVSKPELASAAMRNLRRNSPLGARLRKVKAEFARPRTASSVRTISWLRFDFEPQVDPEDGSMLSLRPVTTDDHALARIGPGMARALGEWALGDAEHPVVKNLLTSATPVAAPTHRSLAARLENVTQALETALRDPGDDGQSLADHAQELAALIGDIDEHEAARGKVALIPMAKGGAAAWQPAMEFEHQLVLVSPQVDAPGIEALGDALVPVLRARPVDASVIVLWGDQAGTAPSGAAMSFLANIAAETRGPQGPRLRVARRSTRISSALAILDGQKVLYSSAPLLTAADDPAPFGFMLSIEAGGRSDLVRRILEMARDRAPDADMARLIELRPWSRSAADGGSPTQQPAPAAATPAEPPAQALGRRVRAHDLLLEARAAAERLEDGGPTVEILTDMALFQSARNLLEDLDPISEEATLWLGFGPDGKRPTPLHRRSVEALARRAERGLQTIVLAPDPSVRASLDITALEAIAAAQPDRLRIIPAPGLTGQFVCGEQRLLVAPGGLASPPVPEARRVSSRLVGVLTSDATVCASFRAELAKCWPALAKMPPSAQRARPRGPTVARPRPASLSSIVEAWRGAPGRPRSELARYLEGPDGGFDAVAAETLLTIATDVDPESACLRRDLLSLLASRGPPALQAAALDELARNAWRCGAWLEAAVLVESQDVASRAIHADMACAMARTVVGLKLAELPAAFQRDEPDAWTASVALGAWAVLFNGDPLAAEALEIKLSLGGGPPGAEPLTRLAEAVVAHWLATGEELDHSALAALARRDEMEALLGLRARTFSDAFRLGVNANYNKQMLKRVVPRFYLTTSGLKPVSDLLEDVSPPVWPQVLRALDAVFGAGRVDAGELAEEILEQTHRTYATGKDEEIAGHKGAAIRQAAREVMQHALELRDTLRGLQQLSASAPRPLAEVLDVLRREAPALATMARDGPSDHIAAPVVAALAARLDQLTGGAP